MVEHRKYYVVNKFAKLDTEKQGQVLISLLKEKYNPKGHPDVINGKISEEEAFKQFCYTFDIYCNIRNIKDIIDYKQFGEYYSAISSSIPNENYFIDLLNGVWGDDNIKEQNNNINNNVEKVENNIPQQQIQNIQNTNNINTNRNINMNPNSNNEMNMNSGYQNRYNKRYRNNRQNIEEAPLKYNESFADSNLGINSVLLGQSSHVMQKKSFGKRSFKKYKYDFSRQDLNNINQNNNNNQIIPQNNEQLNNINNIDNVPQNKYKKTPLTQNQGLRSNNEININYNKINNNNPIINTNRNYRQKFNYNPITNEYKPLNMNNNINNRNNNQYSNNNRIQENLSTEQMTIHALDKLKNIFIAKGPNFIFSYIRKLSLYDFNHSCKISFDNYIYISHPFNINLSNEELKLIFLYFDKEQKGSINYNEFIMNILGKLSQNRELIIKKIFDIFNKDSNGNVALNEIKVLFNANNHPDVLKGKKNRGAVYGEFLENIETFKDYLENMKGMYINNFSFDDFLNFYRILGIGIDNDKIFEIMVNNCWNLENSGLNSDYNNNKIINKNEFNGSNQGNLMARAGSQIVNNIF